MIAAPAGQIALPFAWPPAPRDQEFIVTPSNEAAVRLLERRGAWPVMTALLTGPRKSGRSLLARIVAAKSGATLIDDAQGRDETELFHAWNRAQAERRPLLMIADEPPPMWTVALPDLRSRLAASPVAAIGPPDDALMRALFERLFLRRGLDARAELIEWLAARVERSHLAVIRAVDALDEEALGARRRLSVALARPVLARASLIVEDR